MPGPRVVLVMGMGLKSQVSNSSVGPDGILSIGSDEQGPGATEAQAGAGIDKARVLRDLSLPGRQAERSARSPTRLLPTLPMTHALRQIHIPPREKWPSVGQPPSDQPVHRPRSPLGCFPFASLRPKPNTFEVRWRTAFTRIRRRSSSRPSASHSTSGCQMGGNHSSTASIAW
jgi:hypothetical protein